MSAPTDPGLSPGLSPDLIPLDWNFYATDSSVVFKLEPTALQPYWVEAHAHFGRFNTLPLSITLTSHQKGLDEGTPLLERIFKELLQRRLPAFFGRSGPPADLELQPAIYYFGIRLNLEPLTFDDPLIKHLPRRARAQVEKVLSVIPADELNSIVENRPTPAAEPTLAPPDSANIAPPDSAGIASPLEEAIAPPPSPFVQSHPPTAVASTTIVESTTQEPTTQTSPSRTTPSRTHPSRTPAQKRPAKAQGNPAPSPGFTQAQPVANAIQPSLLGISAVKPAIASQASPGIATTTMAKVAVTTGSSAWDWDEEDDDIVF